MNGTHSSSANIHRPSVVNNNQKFVRILNPTVIPHALTYPHLMLFIDSIHIGWLNRPARRLSPGSRHYYFVVGCCCQIIVGGGHRINVSDDSMLVADVSVCINDGSVGDGSIGDGSILVGDNSPRVNITERALVVNPATATVGLEAATGMSWLSSSLSVAVYGFPQYAWRDW